MNSSVINVQPFSFRIAANVDVVVVQHVLPLRIRKKRRLRKQRRWNCRIRQQRSVWKFLTSLVIPKGIPDELQFLRPPCNAVVRRYHTGIWPEGRIFVGPASRLAFYDGLLVAQRMTSWQHSGFHIPRYSRALGLLFRRSILWRSLILFIQPITTSNVR